MISSDHVIRPTTVVAAKRTLKPNLFFINLGRFFASELTVWFSLRMPKFRISSSN